MYRDKVGRVLRLGELKDEDGDSDNNKVREDKGGTITTPLTAKNSMRMDKKKSATTTASKKNNNKKKPRKESCGVVELVQNMLVLTHMYKLILCMVRDVRNIMARVQAKRHKFGDV